MSNKNKVIEHLFGMTWALTLALALWVSLRWAVILLK